MITTYRKLQPLTILISSTQLHLKNTLDIEFSMMVVKVWFFEITPKRSFFFFFLLVV